MKADNTDQVIRKVNRLYRRRDYDRAIALLESAIGADQANEELYFNLGLVYEAKQEYAAAAEALLQSNALSPGNIGIKWQLGRVLCAVGRSDEAIPHLMDCAAEWPDRSQAHSTLGRAYLESSMLDEAEEAFRKALSIDDSDPDAVDGSMWISEQRGDEEKVSTILAEYLDKNPDLPTSHAFYADFLNYEEGDAVGALPYYERALMLWERRKKTEWLGSFFSTADYPRSIVQDYWNALVASGYLDIARRLVEENMTGVRKVLFRALIEGEKGNHEESRRILEGGLKKFPQSDSIIYLLAFEYLRRGLNMKASQQIDAAMDKKGGADQDVRYAAVGYIAATELNQVERASTILDDALERFGNDFWAALAYHWRDLSRWEESLAACDQFLGSDAAEDVHVLGYKAEALVGLARCEEALGVYEKLSDLQPKNGKILIEMAKVCALISEYDRAEALLQRAESGTNLSRPQREEIAQLRLKISSH
jgi:tetratricopeptide (TPR) repeat protein